MSLSICSHRGIKVLVVSGRLDHTNAEAFKAEFLPAVEQAIVETKEVILDLAGLDYISSSALRILMLASRAASAKGATLAAAALNPVVKEIFDISRFSSFIPCAETLDEAVARFRTPEKREDLS
jgi:anti-anti-sigma factor